MAPGKVRVEVSHQADQDAENTDARAFQGRADSRENAGLKDDGSKQDERKPGGHGAGDRDAACPQHKQREPQLLREGIELPGQFQV